MLHNLTPQPIPKLFALTQQYKGDTRSPKMDLGLGVYCNEAGITPIFKAVKQAEHHMVNTQQTKTYQPLSGHPEFCQSLAQLVLGAAVPYGRIATAAAPGGTASIRLICALIKLAHPSATIWIPNVTWLNHAPIIDDVGLSVRQYRYYHRQNCRVDFAAMKRDMQSAKPGDSILLHACCHNPSGADLTPQQWHEIAQIAQDNTLIPLVDMAYQGFGEGIDGDAYGVRYLARHLPQVFVAVSASKNFGLYRDRIGLAMVVVADGDDKKRVHGNLALICRINWSMAPDHGAEIVHTILSDSTMKTLWQDELSAMRVRIRHLRGQLHRIFKAQTHSGDFDFITTQRGMFSMLPISPAQVERLREVHAIYMLPNGRISIASMQPALMPYFVESFLSVTRQ